MNKYLTNFNSEDCCGCSACVQKCPKHCLKMTSDKDGFYFPVVSDTDICIECGICSKVCPLENLSVNMRTGQFYAAYNSSLDDIMASSSGGVFPTVAKMVLTEGGFVFGAYLDEDHKLYHIGISELKDLNKILGSKYIQSDIRNTFIECKGALKQGKKALFIGTPCQIQALRCFLVKECDNLITLDVICHGTPSPKIFNAYVDYLEKKHKAKLVDINFRDKTRNGWSITLRYTMEYANARRKNYYLISKLSEYFTAFLGGAIARDSCYNCPFSSMERPGDLTLGDFWGYQATRPDLKHEEGLSLVLVNSKKGRLLMEQLGARGIVINEVDENAVLASENKNLYKPTFRPSVRNTVYDELENEGFSFIAKKYFQKNQTWKNYLKNYLPVCLVKFLVKK